MLNIKSDFHLHTRDDREDSIGHSETELIDHAAARGFGALAITNHNTHTFNKELQRYAEDRGILLIPGRKNCLHRLHLGMDDRIRSTHIFQQMAIGVTDNRQTFLLCQL